MANITWVISNVVDNSGGQLSAAQSTAVQNLLIAAGEEWEKYLNPSQPITFEMELVFGDTMGNLATAGPNGFFATGEEVNGIPVFQPTTVIELQSGTDSNGAMADLTVTIPFDLSNQFIETDLANRNAPIAQDTFDLFGTLVHELGHALGFFAFRREGAPSLTDEQTLFDTLFTENDLNFTGPATTALLGNEGAPISPNDFSHLGDENGTPNSLSNLLSIASILAPAGGPVARNYITPLEVAILQDTGLPVSMTTQGNDILNGFDPLNLSEFFSAQEIAALPQIFLDLTDGVDALSGGGGDDILAGLRGDDALDGGAGRDTAVFNGNQASHTLIIDQTGRTTITDRSGTNGTDTLSNIEFLDFDVDFGNQPFNLEQVGGLSGLNAADLQAFIELYIAYFNRAPDAVGLSFWGTAFANGTTLEQTAALFIDQDETRALYAADLSNTDFATAVYNNVLGRVADQAGFDFWVGVLNDGSVGRDQFILSILGGAKADPPADAGADFVAQQLADRAFLSNKTDIGTYFAVTRGMSDTTNATTAMQMFDRSQADIGQAIAAIDEFYNAALAAEGGEFLMQIVGILDDPSMMV